MFLNFKDLREGYNLVAVDLRDNFGIAENIILEPQEIREILGLENLEIRYNARRKSITFRIPENGNGKFKAATKLDKETFEVLSQPKTIAAIRAALLDKYNSACAWKKSFYDQIHEIINKDLR